MAAYPSFDQLISSTLQFTDDLVVDTAVNGTSRARSFYPATKAKLSLRHMLSDADLATLNAFYDANKLEPVTVTWQRTQATYNCLMTSRPTQAIQSGSWTSVAVNLVEQ